jgi:hypothetical protein
MLVVVVVIFNILKLIMKIVPNFPTESSTAGGDTKMQIPKG